MSGNVGKNIGSIIPSELTHLFKPDLPAENDSFNIRLIIDQLTNLNIKIEDIFMRLAQSFPNLFYELEAGMDKAHRFIQDFSNN